MLKKSIPAITGNLYGKQERLDEALLAPGRPDSSAALLPERSVFLDSCVRNEALMSLQIEGTQSSLADLTLFEAEGARTSSLGRVAPSALQVHQAMFGRPVTGMRRNRIYEYSACLEILNRESEP